MSSLPAQTVTEWLLKWRDGDDSALDELTERVYADLRRLAQTYLRHERPDHTLQATALVHEAYLQIQSLQHLPWKNRGHFIGVVAQVMRHVLVDHARERAAQKRGGGAIKVPLSGAEDIAADADLELIALNDALDRLAIDSPRKARVVELYYFGGLRASEIADVLTGDGTAIAQRTVESDLQIARARLHRMLRESPEDR